MFAALVDIAGFHKRKVFINQIIFVRFQKCVAVGMDARAIQNDRDRYS